MIIVKLWGGLCNQMFQYAFGYSLATRYNDELGFDVSFYDNQPSYVGKRSVINGDFFPLLHINYINRPTIVSFLNNKYISYILRHNWGCDLRLPNIHFFMEELQKNDKAKYYEEVPYIKNTINYYDGYWQSSSYFSHYMDDIHTLFTPKKFIINSVYKWRYSLNNDCCVAVHVRRGDYVVNKNLKKNSKSVVNKVDYYWDGIKLIESKFDNPLFCFFSDDIEWCKVTFGEKCNSIFVINKGPYSALIDLFSIAACDHGIMSQSTFSWWGNWLRGKNKDTIVLCPKDGLTNDKFAEESFVLV